MVRLTEEMIVARTRVSDMTNVKKLNCWGAELTDVSVLRKLVNVEVLSLSVNCITTLADIQNCKNLQELYIRKNKIPDLNEVCWLRELTKLKNLWLEENPCCNQTQSELYRATVIRNLPQLQKLDNVVVQPDEVADSMRRGIELIHPYDADESIPYTTYAPPGPQSYQQQPQHQHHQAPTSSISGSRRGSQIDSQAHQQHQYDERRMSSTSQFEQYSCPSRRVSNQVFDPPLVPTNGSITTNSSSISPVLEASAASQDQSSYSMVRSGSVSYMEDGYVPDYHTGRKLSTQLDQGPVRRSPRVSLHSMEEPVRRMSIQDSGNNYEDERNANSYNVSRANSVQPLDPYQHQPRNSYTRSNSDPAAIVGSKLVAANKRSLSAKSSSRTLGKLSKAIKEQSETNDPDCSANNLCKSSRHNSDEDEQVNFCSLQLDQRLLLSSNNTVASSGGKLKLPSSPTNADSTKKCMNCNGGASSPSTASTASTGKMSYEEDPRSILASHYEQTYEAVDQQIASAQQLLEERKLRSQISPERPYPRRPKNRNSNILSAVLCLIKELDAPSLEVAEMAIRCRMEELDD